MINNKVILTYKRKHVSSHSDSAHVNEGNASKSLKKLSKSDASNDQLKGDTKFCFSCPAHDSNGVVLGRSGSPRSSACNDHSSESLELVERWQGAPCDKQHVNAGELVQQQDQVSDNSKRCENAQKFEEGLTEHSHHCLVMEVASKDAAASMKANATFENSISTIANGTLQMKENSNFQSSDQHNTVIPTFASPDPLERKCTSLCREESSSGTFVLGEKKSPLEEKSEILLLGTVNRERSRTPLRIFYRRAKKIKERSETGILGHSNIVRGEGSTSEQSPARNSFCRSDESKSQTLEVPIPRKEKINCDNLDAKSMVKKPTQIPSGEDSSKSSVAKERSKVSAGCSGTKFAGKHREERTVEARSNFRVNNSIKESSSGAIHMDKQFKAPKTVIASREVPATISVDAVCNPRQSDGFQPNISLCDLASNRATPSSLCENMILDNTSLELPHSRSSFDSVAHEANGGEKEHGFLENMERQKHRVVCTSRADVDINRKLPFEEDDTLHQLSRNCSLPDPAVPQMQDFLRDTMNHNGSPRRRKIIRNASSTILEGQSGIQATGTIFRDFLGPVITQRKSIIDPNKNFRSMSPISNVKGSGYSHEVQLPWQASDGNSSLLRHKQILDDIITSSRMLNKRHDYYFANCRRYPSVWSEEELDSLWIGVRRHGRGNWNCMLRDPKLHFAGWRIADDLAERWDVEQTKLLGTPLIQPLRSLGPDNSSSSSITNRLLTNSAVDSSHWNYLPEIQNSRHEMGLTLGGVYLGKGVNRNPNHLTDFAVHPLAGTGSLGAGSSYSYGGEHQGHPSHLDPRSTHQRHGKTQGRYDLGPSMLDQCSIERSTASGHQVATLSASTNLPHWLKEVLGTPASPSEQTMLSTVSNFEHSMVSHAGEQRGAPPFSYPNDLAAVSKDARRGILKRRGAKSSNAGGLNLFTLRSVESKVSDANVLDLNRSSSEVIEPNNLVIIDGDASSEETISDDQSGRP